jgi:hypothetical protein
VSSQYFPCSFVPTLPPCARPAFGWGSNPPSCSCSAGASSRGVLPGAGALAGCRTPIQPVCSISARATRQIEIETIALPRSPCAESLKPPPSPTKSREMAHGLVSDALEIGGPRCAPLAVFTASQITNHLVSLTTAYVFTTYQLSDEKYPTWAYLNTRAACHLGTCVAWLPMTYPEITSACASQIKSSQGASSQHAFIHSIEMDATYQVRTFLVRSSWPIHEGLFPLTRSFCSFRFIEGQKFCMCVCVGGYYLSAPTRNTATTRGLACKAAGQTRAKIWRG